WSARGAPAQGEEPGGDNVHRRRHGRGWALRSGAVMKTSARKALVIMGLLVLAGCADDYGRRGPPPGAVLGGPSAPNVPYGHATEMQIERSMDRYSALLTAMDAEGLASMYTPDGVMERQSGGPLRGREEIRAFLASAGSNVRVLSNQMTTVSLAYNGPAVVQTGEFRQSVRANGKVINASGRFEATWVRGPHGEWF